VPFRALIDAGDGPRGPLQVVGYELAFARFDRFFLEPLPPLSIGMNPCSRAMLVFQNAVAAAKIAGRSVTSQVKSPRVRRERLLVFLAMMNLLVAANGFRLAQASPLLRFGHPKGYRGGINGASHP